MSFLPQVEGLRAIAVLVVIAFHYAPSRFGGGFLGVDVFYVISGFLITQIILRSQADNRFSLLEFYRRRILRLGPAIAVVIGASLLFGWFVLFGGEYAHLGRSAAASALFVQNFNLYAEGGYFDEHAELKVLLHLWSLSVEMQFYLFWGVLVYALRRKPRVLVNVVIASLLLSLALLALVARGSKESFFYLPQYRLWEFAAGGLVYLLADRGAISRRLGDPVAQVGGVILLLAVVALGDDRHVAISIVASVAVTAILLCTISAGATTFILNNRVAVFIGRISYPLYMWHWPLLAYARIIESEEPSRMMRVALVIAAFALGSATFFFVERPLRGIKNKPMLAAALSGVFGILAICGVIVTANNGLPERATVKSFVAGQDAVRERPVRLMPCNAEIERAFKGISDCVTTGQGTPTRLLIGDSHAKQLVAALSRVDTGSTWMLLSYNSCPPVLGVQFYISGTPICPGFTEEVVRFVHGKGFKTALVAFASTYLQTTSYGADQKMTRVGPEEFSFEAGGHMLPNAEAFGRGLKEFAARLQGEGISVWIAADNFELPFFPKSCIGRPLKWNYNAVCSVPIAEVRARQQVMFDVLEALKRDSGVGVINLNEALCDETSCHARIDGQVVYRDSHHVNERGAVLLAQKITSALK